MGARSLDAVYFQVPTYVYVPGVSSVVGTCAASAPRTDYFSRLRFESVKVS